MLKSSFQPIITDAEVWCLPEGASEFQRTNSLSSEAPGETTKLIERVSEEGRPGILHQENDFPDTAYDRFGRRAAIGIPVIVSGKVNSILTLFVQCSSEATGAIEVWERDRQRDELGLRGAVFSKLGRFANVSHYIKFPRGSGLPGRCWEDRQVKLVDRLGSSPDFMRAAGARAVGLDLGVALPMMGSEHELHSVIQFLSSSRSPIARVYEIWDITDDTSQIQLRSCSHVQCDSFEATTRYLEYRSGEGIVGKTWETGQAMVCSDLPSVDPKRASAASADGITSAIAMPVFVGEFLKSVFLMFN